MSRVCVLSRMSSSVHALARVGKRASVPDGGSEEGGWSDCESDGPPLLELASGCESDGPPPLELASNLEPASQVCLEPAASSGATKSWWQTRKDQRAAQVGFAVTRVGQIAPRTLRHVGGCLVRGQHLVTSWATTQVPIYLSSGDAGFLGSNS